MGMGMYIIVIQSMVKVPNDPSFIIRVKILLPRLLHTAN